MNSKKRFIKTLEGGKADRMPVTMHHLMPSFLDIYMNGISDLDFFDFLDLCWGVCKLRNKSPVSDRDGVSETRAGVGFLSQKASC